MGFEQGYAADTGTGLDEWDPDDSPDGGYPATTGNPQFAEVYHQPYNQSHDALPAISEEDQAHEPDEAYAYRLEDDERAAYLADYQRTLARDEYLSDVSDEEDDLQPEDDAYARAGGYDPTQTSVPLTPLAPPKPRPEPNWTPPPANRVPMSAAPPAWPSVIPTQRTAAPPINTSPVAASPIPISTTPTPAPRLPVDRLTQFRRQAQRRPAAAARGFVPSPDRIGTAREVMTYLARRPWLQLDVVDIILGTQFDRDDVAHALIVLQQTGRIRSHLRGDRVCYSYAAT